MAPTLRSRDRVLVLRRWPTKWLQKGQIVIGDLGQVLTASEQMPPEARAKPLSATSNFIKRVVGLPGDTVVIHISELHEMMRPSLQPRCDSEGNLVWHIPPGHCFVRGDAPPGSDSITWGPIPLDTLSGVMLTKLPHRADSDQIACS